MTAHGCSHTTVIARFSEGSRLHSLKQDLGANQAFFEHNVGTRKGSQCSCGAPRQVRDKRSTMDARMPSISVFNAAISLTKAVGNLSARF